MKESATRRHFSAEDKIRIVSEGLRGEASIAELCRREGIVQNLVEGFPPWHRWQAEYANAARRRCSSK